MKRKVEEKLKAIELREQGYSVNEIVQELGVAKSSISVWVRNIELTQEAQNRLLTRITQGQLIGAEKRRERTRTIMKMFRTEALKSLMKQKINKDLARIICSLVYWCEGTKDPFNGMRFTNSDPLLIRTFLVLLRRSFCLDEANLRVGLHLHEYHDVGEQVSFWSKVTGISKDRFIKPYLKPHTGKRIRKNYPGCATIYYHRSEVAKKMLATAQVFFENTGA